MMMVCRFLFVGVVTMVCSFTKALLAVEHEEIHAEGIESRDKHTRQHGEVGKSRRRQGAEMHGLDDRIFGIEAREKWRTDQRQRTQQRSDPGYRHVTTQAAHIANVLIVVHAHDDGTRSQKEQRLEEGMRHQVEDADLIGRSAQRDGHIAQLRERRVRHHALDVVLDDAQQTHEQRRDRADDQDEIECSV